VVDKPGGRGQSFARFRAKDRMAERQVLRAGVVGAGVFGGYHAGQYARQDDVVLACVYDIDRARAEALAAKHGARAVGGLDELWALVDVASIASPAVAHAAEALAGLEAGRSLYVEKPIATRLDEADRIGALSAERKLVVACGFLERAGLEAMGLFDVPERPLLLEAARLNTAGSRNLDVSVVLDLMIHDLDLALAITHAQPVAVEAEGAMTANDSFDVVEAEATFDDGFTARFRASRVAEARERTMRIVYPSGEVRVDFLKRAFTNTTPFPLDSAFDQTPAGRDPLGASIARFLDAVRGEAPGPLVDAADGARALDLALAVEQAVTLG
jgi:predicted dehydrogenase